jgi:hypothetical protein
MAAALDVLRAVNGPSDQSIPSEGADDQETIWVKKSLEFMFAAKSQPHCNAETEDSDVSVDGDEHDDCEYEHADSEGFHNDAEEEEEEKGGEGGGVS